MNRTAMSIRICSLFAALLAFASTGCNNVAPVERPPLEGSSITGAFNLIDKTDKTVNANDFAGKYRIVYFGFTFCPDACPTDVSVMMQGYDIFAKSEPELAAQIQPIFISIDPARDTPDAVGKFAAAFSPKLLGLTGSAAQIDSAAKAFSVFYAKGKSTPGGYLMDHSRIAYLIGRKGEPIAMLPVDEGRDAVAKELTKWVK